MKRSVCLLLVMTLAVVMLLTGCGKGGDYKKAVSLYEEGKYEEAAAIFTELGDYEDSENYVKECEYSLACEMLESGDYEGAIEKFEALGDFKDSSHTKINEAKKGLIRQKYGDVLDALNGNTWYFNGGEDTILNGITFNETQATISQVSFNENGKQEGESNSFDFSLDDNNIIITLVDGSTMEIPYSVSDGKVKLDKTYFSVEQIEKGIQGYWKCRTSDTILGKSIESEYNIYFNKGKVKSESASITGGFYYGPYEGTYTLNFGGFDTDIMHGDDWFYNIIDGKVAVLHYDDVCKPTDKLPGMNGYDW